MKIKLSQLINNYRYYVIPVVYGGANYSMFAPPNSYINVLDFNSTKSLADYLLYLTKNPDEYKKYFEWKKYYRIIPPKERLICQLCEMANDKNSKSFENINEWYNNERRCPMKSIWHH